ncbi:hypothetical protein Mapa_006658 [Marchantia paleacea]|nr:hypothetical protein Mapa_006658 [Marchantia paleacea]
MEHMGLNSRVPLRELLYDIVESPFYKFKICRRFRVQQSRGLDIGRYSAPSLRTWCRRLWPQIDGDRQHEIRPLQ